MHPTRIARQLALSVASRHVIRHYDEFVDTARPRRALLSYLVLPLLPPPKYRDRVKFSNRGIAQEVPRALNELGYVVDIVNYDNATWRPRSAYDLFVGHGGMNFEKIGGSLPAATRKIYFSTGLYWREWNRRIAARAHDFTARHGVVLPFSRPIIFPEEYGNRTADGIICLGNHSAAASYSSFPKVVAIDNAVYPVPASDVPTSRPLEARRHFLFFSGRGNVMKGLDLLLDAFGGSGLHLHVCQHIEPEFSRVYRSQLADGTVHVHGFTRMRSPEFRALARECVWIIAPTAAEGQPGALLECMAYGLVPVFSDAANIDLGNYGIPLGDCSVESIRHAIEACAEMPPDEIERRSTEAVAIVKRRHTPDSFRRRFREAVASILAGESRGQGSN